MDARNQLQRRRRAQVRLALWGAIGLTLILLREVLFPFLMGALLAYLLAPLVTSLSARPLPGLRGRTLPPLVALILTYLVGLGLLALLARLVVPNLYRETLRLAARLTTAIDTSSGRLQATSAGAHEWLRSHGFPIEGGDTAEDVGAAPRFDLEATLRAWPRALQGRLFEFFGIGRQVLRTLLGGLYAAILTLVTGALFLLGREQIFEFVRQLLPDRGSGGLEQLLRRFDRRLSGVVRGQATICLINGTLTLAGLLLFRVEFPFVLAAQATVFSLIPIFGTFISSVPIVIIALQQGFPVGLSMFGWILAIHALEAYLLNPKILGDATRIHPLVILFALVAGEHYFGLWGAFLAAPIAAVAVAAVEQAEFWAEAGPA